MAPFSTRREGIADDDSKNQRTIRRGGLLKMAMLNMDQYITHRLNNKRLS